MERKEKILYHVELDGQGLEIGPSHSPIVPKKAGYKVDTIDHMTREQLVEKYTSEDVKLENIEEVDFVWSGQPYAKLTGKTAYYDWIIASHIIEHSTDFIGFLNDCDSIMKDIGVISLVVPDKRFCFDHFRPHTGIAEIIDAHNKESTIHSPGTVAEFFLNIVYRDGQNGWDYLKEGEYEFVHQLDEARAEISKAAGEDEYLDVHAWCFTPHSFRLIIHDLNALGLISLQEVSFFPTAGHEFYVTLGRKGTGTGLSRMEMLKKVEDELQEVAMDKIKSRLAATEENLDEAESEIERIHASNSWKITGPLRKLRPLADSLARLLRIKIRDA